MGKETKFCQFCGHKISETAKFCPACGQEVSNGDSAIVDESDKKLTGITVNIGSSDLKLQFNDNTMHNIFLWLAQNIYLTVAASLGLFVVYSFSRLLGWILTFVMIGGVFVIINNKKVAVSNMEKKLRGKVEQGVDPESLKSAGDSISRSIKNAVDGKSSGKAEVSAVQWITIRIIFLGASILTLLTSYVGSFFSADVYIAKVDSGSLYRIISSLANLNSTLGLNSSNDSDVYVLLLIIGLGPVMGIIVSFLKSRFLPLVSVIVTIAGYFLALEGILQKLKESSEMLKPGSALFMAILGIIIMAVMSILISIRKN